MRAGDWLKTDLKHVEIWTPVAIGLGAGVYFGLKSEPPAALGVGALAAAALAFRIGRPIRPVAAAFFLLALGFVAADLRTARVAAPILERELDIRSVTGRLVAVEDGIDSDRFLIALHAIEGIDKEDLPARARITWRGGAGNAEIGDTIALRAGLRPSPAPAAPGTFDYARQLYFQRIGAVGFAVSEPMAVEPAAGASATTALSVRIETFRAHLFERITAAAAGQGGAVVAAIVTGKRDAINEETKAALRDAGLAHLLAISGLHMGLATGLMFFVVRFVLAAIEPLALRFPIKKFAAAAALMSGLFYLILSGGAWSAQRAFIMTAIILVAVLFDRRALSLRNLAIAAAIILLTTPEAVFHAGFQMSFAVVTALIAGYEEWGRRKGPERSFTRLAWIKRYVVGLMVTDMIASIAVAPFALYHFNRVALYSLPANMLAMPLMAFCIIPAAVAALFLTPFGLDGLAWRGAAAGFDAVSSVAESVSSLPGSVSLTPQWPLAALLVLTFGGLWLCLARSPLRLAGLAGLPLAVIFIQAARVPDLYVAASGLNAAVVASHGATDIFAYTGRRDRFSLSVWGEAAGLPEGTRAAPMDDLGACDRAGCVVALPDKGVVSFLEDPAALAEECARADLVVAFFPVSQRVRRGCDAVLIDRRAIWEKGAHGVWLDDGAARLKTVSQMRGVRPWTGAG
jgi:competence protein ComEC